MSAHRTVKLGSRGSALALRQDEEVLALLRPLFPQLDFQVVVVRTLGDVDKVTDLTGMGLGIFVKEIEQELLQGRLDFAVHSLKDLPTQLPDGLTLGAVPQRQDPRDVLVNRWGCSLADLPSGARIGTSSPRRQALLKSLCPQAQPVPIRGNVETRLRKARGEECDGAILAAAGLARLGLAKEVAEYLPPHTFVPPPGQGALAIQVRSSDTRMLELLGAINHAETRDAVTAERGFLEALGGGCQLPLGAYARTDGQSLLMDVFLGSGDGKDFFAAQVSGPKENPAQLAADAHQELIRRGAGRLPENFTESPVPQSEPPNGR